MFSVKPSAVLSGRSRHGRSRHGFKRREGTPSRVRAAKNGEFELWIDGQEIIHLTEGAPRGSWNGGVFTRGANGMPFEGFQWRSDAALATNFVWLDVYVTDSPAGRMWFDDLVVARRYVGPLEASGGACP